MRAIVIVNRKSGPGGRDRDADWAGRLTALFAEEGWSPEIRLLDPAKLEDAFRQAAADTPDIVFAGGGDGTIRSAAAVLAGTPIALGVLPLGTLNHFACDLGVPLEMEKAVAALVHGSTEPVDVAEVNGHVFINNCSLGSYADAIRRRDALRAEHGWSKKWAMIRASLQVFRQLRRHRLHLHVDGQDLGPTRTPLALIANNRYCGRLQHRNLRPRLDAGELWLYTVRVRRHLPVLRMVLQSFVRRLDDADALESRPARQVVIDFPGQPAPIAADGEIVELKPPLRFRIRAGGLRVRRPRPPETK